MLRSLEPLLGYQVWSKDGATGRVADFLLVDDRWTVCWVVVALRNWFVKRQVLLPVSSLDAIGPEERRLDVGLTREQIERSPEADTEKPVTRQKAIVLAQRYGWKAYRSAPPFRGISLVHHRPDVPEDLRGCNTHLRSFRELTSYEVKRDGRTRFMKDVLVDDANWAIRGLVTSEGLLDVHDAAIVDPAAVSAINWTERRVELRNGDFLFSPWDAGEAVESGMPARSYGNPVAVARTQLEEGFRDAGNGSRAYQI